MAMLTSNGLEPFIWVLLVAFALGWGALTLKAAIQRRTQAKVSASSDSLHIHYFPLSKDRHRKCLICGVRA